MEERKIARMQYLQKADTVPNHRKAGERQAALGYAPKRNTDSGFGSLTLLIHPIP